MSDDKSKSVTAWVSVVLTSLGLFAGSAKGFYEYGVDQRWWGRRMGTIERVNAYLAPKYLMATPVTEAEFQVSDRQHIRAKAYKDGVIAVFQRIDDEMEPSGYRQTLIFLTPKPWDDVLAEIDAKEQASSGWVRSAYAEERLDDQKPVPIVPVAIAFEDTIIENDAANLRVKIERRYANGCIERFWMDMTNGAIIPGTFESTCSPKPTE